VELKDGIVLLARSGKHRVQGQDGEEAICDVRGRLKQEQLDTDLVATGDRVKWRQTRPGRGVIEEVLERETQLSRRRPGTDVEQVLVANPDQAVFIFAAREPEPRLRMLDRLLVLAENNDLPALICINKVDLVTEEEDLKELVWRFAVYEEIGYPVVYTSALTGLGVDELREHLAGKLSVLSGPSGVGKTSLLNAIQPELGLQTREISEATGKGRHTTVATRLWPLEVGGYVADTPGLREAGLWDIEPEELAWHFVEMREYVPHCRFSSCSHTHEPGCAVKAAVEAGEISEERYESYCLMLEGDVY
jgi:ribosome biogenesis GTPase / thiamine phosphate phosphatase